MTVSRKEEWVQIAELDQQDQMRFTRAFQDISEPPHRAGSGLDLSVAWYRDVLRAKLVSLRLPVRLLLEYKAKVLAQIEESERPFRDR